MKLCFPCSKWQGSKAEDQVDREHWERSLLDPWILFVTWEIFFWIYLLASIVTMSLWVGPARLQGLPPLRKKLVESSLKRPLKLSQRAVWSGPEKQHPRAKTVDIATKAMRSVR